MPTMWSDIYRKAGLIDFCRQAIPWLFSYRFFEQPRAVERLLRYAAHHPQAPAAFARQVAASLGHDTLARLRLIRVPTLVVAGEEDILVPLRIVAPLATAIPGASLAIIPTAGHAVNVEQPAALNGVVQAFLRSRA